MRLVAILQTLDSACDRMWLMSSETPSTLSIQSDENMDPSQSPVSNQVLWERVSEMLSRSDADKMTEVSRLQRDAVTSTRTESQKLQRAFFLKLIQFRHYRPSLFNISYQVGDRQIHHSLIRVYLAPVQTKILTFLVIRNMCVGYVNIFPDRAVITMTTMYNPINFRQIVWVGIQGTSKPITDPDELENLIYKPYEFWNAVLESNERNPPAETAEKTFTMVENGDIALDHSDTNAKPFNGQYDERIKIERGMVSDTWELGFDTGHECFLRGVVYPDITPGAVSLWCKAFVRKEMNQLHMDSFCKTYSNNHWIIFSMKHKLKTAKELEQYIIECTWSDPSEALLVIPADTDFLAKWEKNLASVFQNKILGQICPSSSTIIERTSYSNATAGVVNPLSSPSVSSSSMRMYPAPVKTQGVLACVVFPDFAEISKGCIGFVSILTDGVMVTMLDGFAHDNIDNYHERYKDLDTSQTAATDFDCNVSVQGLRNKFTDSRSLMACLRKDVSFWLFDHTTLQKEENPRAEIQFTLATWRHFLECCVYGEVKRSNLQKDNGTELQIIFIKDASGNEQFSLKTGNAYVRGIILKNSGNLYDVWAKTVYKGALDTSRLDPFFHDKNNNWVFFSAKSGIESLTEVRYYIKETNWSESRDILFISPQDMSLWEQWKDSKSHDT